MRVTKAGTYLSFAEVLHLLTNSREFREWYTDCLQGCDHKAIYWEHPPLSTKSMSCPYDVTLIDAPALAATRPDSRPFHTCFAASPGLHMAVFKNLGGDATLIAPKPGNTNADCSHLLSFIRSADNPLLDAFWRCTAASVQDSLSQTPIWLSTAGGGVDWLHVRIDSWPKYYRCRRYRDLG
jgi:hypothetical protein